MRRVLFGIVWFFIFFIGGMMLGGAIVGGLAGRNVSATSGPPPSTMSESYNAAYDAGHAAGQAFGRKYGQLFLLGSLILAIGGTALGWLPGTKPRPAAVAPSA